MTATATNNSTLAVAESKKNNSYNINYNHCCWFFYVTKEV